MAEPIPQFVARCEITNGDGTFDSEPPGEVRGDGLDVCRVKFKVKKTLDPAPNTAEIELFNLDQATIDLITGTVRKRIEYTPEDRDQLRELGLNLSEEQIAQLTSAPIETVYDNFGIASVRLSWGYRGSQPGAPNPPISLGFLGGSTKMKVRDDGLSKVLVLSCEDGGQLLGTGTLQKSYRPGASYLDILSDLITSCGVSVDRSLLETTMTEALFKRGIPVGTLQTIQGYNAATAPAAEQVRTVMDSLQLRWSVQDGEFLLVDSNTVLAGFEPLVLSADRGNLFGNPEQLEALQLRAKTWATAEAKPAREVLVESTNRTTQYRIDNVDHAGDAYSGGQSTVTLDAVQTIPGVF